jgi:uncharacterized protein YceH (UPF0502 family)
MEPLSAAEARVLGSLVEKDITTPDYYPLTLNALVNACNQSSNRDPVMTLGEAAVEQALGGLRERKLAFMFQGADSRVAKFGHRVAETLELARPETAVLCVLLLRGPQTVGEVRGRAARMHEFESLESTEAALQALAARPPEALAVRLARQPGMKEQRYAHLLSGAVTAAAAEEAPAPAPAGDPRIARLEVESTALRAEVTELRRQLDELKRALGQ